MYQKERLRVILGLLEQNGFVTVRFLTEQMHYSTATINRDLNALQNQGLIKRSFGGAELTQEKTVPLHFRYSKMRPAKSRIAKLAATHIQNGDTIFIDCSTTAQYLGKYITDRKNLTVITNNLTLASFLSEYSITSICLGGRIMEPPAMAYSEETVENARKYGADKLFFSACSITPDGRIGRSQYESHYLMIRAMMENSAQKYLLMDVDKLVERDDKYLGTLAEIDTVISDFPFPERTKEFYPQTTFLQV